MKMIDLRSDTVTRPTSGMLEAIAKAKVGDDVYGDDPTVIAFEAKVAELFGKEAGLFTATGSIANQLGIRSLIKPGEELLADERAHVVRAELGAAAVLSGVTTRTFHSPKARLNPDSAIALAHPNAGPYLVSTVAIAVENTHNFGGGVVQNIEAIERLHHLAAPLGIKLHLDGARIWNAHVASSVPFARYGACFETVSVCFSKGLGAPIGSMLLSTRERIEDARIWRKRFGGGMRQVGLLAAAADYGLTHHLARLATDHAHARKIAEAISAVDSRLVDLESVETNIVGIELQSTRSNASDFAKKLGEAGVLSGALGSHYLRLVTHGDLTSSDIDEATEVITTSLRAVL
ncbi:MAG: low specificity L-threonine aldolase [Actinobacteria bacterium]|nr:low specificity L-threonine aldolase [Actinomycetota bacterium]